jgi:protein involved in polysaccharide export with SLBB domain
MSRDRIVVLSVYGDRVAEIAPYVARLKLQAKLGHLPRVVKSGGALRFPGEYPLVDRMSVSDLIALSGGLRDSAYSQSAEIARIDLSNPNRAVTTIMPISLNTDLVTILEPSDYVEFRTIPYFKESETISLEGEFVFPGMYAFEVGETLTSVIQRAGGFTDAAFSGGSVFVREDLKERQQKELDRLSQTLNEDLNAKMLSDANSDVEVDGAQLALQQSAIAALSSLEAIGRLVIPLGDIMSFSAEDIILKNNDRLMVPRFSQEVTVIGEVHRQTSYLFNPDFSQVDYIGQSGGMKPGADKGRVYVVKANGEVSVRPRSLFLFRAAQENIEPGDTIIVPPDPDHIKFRPLPLLAEVSKIIYELALGAAAINSFSTP